MESILLSNTNNKQLTTKWFVTTPFGSSRFLIIPSQIRICPPLQHFVYQEPFHPFHQAILPCRDSVSQSVTQPGIDSDRGSSYSVFLTSATRCSLPPIYQKKYKNNDIFKIFQSLLETRNYRRINICQIRRINKIFQKYTIFNTIKIHSTLLGVKDSLYRQYRISKIDRILRVIDIQSVQHAFGQKI